MVSRRDAHRLRIGWRRLPARAGYLCHASGRQSRPSHPVVASWCNYDHVPRFSPEGRRLVFTRDGDDGAALFTTDLSGHTNQSPRMPSGQGMPSGHHTETRSFEAQDGDVHVVDSNGKHLRNLTNYAREEQGGGADPVWSPDGRKILFLEGIVQQQGSPRVLGLAIMGSDGSNRHFIEGHPIESHQPDWCCRWPGRGGR